MTTFSSLRSRTLEFFSATNHTTHRQNAILKILKKWTMTEVAATYFDMDSSSSEDDGEYDGDEQMDSSSSDDDGEYDSDSTPVAIPDPLRDVEFYVTSDNIDEVVRNADTVVDDYDVTDKHLKTEAKDDYESLSEGTKQQLRHYFTRRLGRTDEVVDKVILCMFIRMAKDTGGVFQHQKTSENGRFVSARPLGVRDGDYKALEYAPNAYVVYKGKGCEIPINFDEHGGPTTPEKIMQRRNALTSHYDRDNLFFLTECVGLCLTLHDTIGVKPTVETTKAPKRKVEDHCASVRKRPRLRRRPKSVMTCRQLPAARTPTPAVDQVSLAKSALGDKNPYVQDGTDDELKMILCDVYSTVTLPSDRVSPHFKDVLSTFMWQGQELPLEHDIVRKLKAGQCLFDPERCRQYVVQSLVPWLRLRQEKFEKLANTVHRRTYCTNCMTLYVWGRDMQTYQCCESKNPQYIAHGFMTSMRKHLRECADASGDLADSILKLPKFEKSKREITAFHKEVYCPFQEHTPQEIIHKRVSVRMEKQKDMFRHMSVNIPVWSPSCFSICCGHQKVHKYDDQTRCVHMFNLHTGKYLASEHAPHALKTLHIFNENGWWAQTKMEAPFTIVVTANIESREEAEKRVTSKQKKPTWARTFDNIYATAVYYDKNGKASLVGSNEIGIYKLGRNGKGKIPLAECGRVTALAVKNGSRPTTFAYAKGAKMTWHQGQKPGETVTFPGRVTGLFFCGSTLYAICDRKELYVVGCKKSQKKVEFVKVYPDANEFDCQAMRVFWKSRIPENIERMEVYGSTIRMFAGDSMHHCIAVQTDKNKWRMVVSKRVSKNSASDSWNVYVNRHYIAVGDDASNVQMWNHEMRDECDPVLEAGERKTFINTKVCTNPCVKCGENIQVEEKKMCDMCLEDEKDRKNFTKLAPEVYDIARKVLVRSRSITPDPSLVLKTYDAIRRSTHVQPTRFKPSPQRPGEDTVTGSGMLYGAVKAEAEFRRSHSSSVFRRLDFSE